MSDVENELDELQRKLATKTREIEAVVAAEQNLGDLSAIDSTENPNSACPSDMAG
jgi:hypothetical protein